jgi:hypothetical protein
VNPRLALVKELTREIEKTREHLGILPLARIRLNIAENAEKSGVAGPAAQAGRRGRRQGPEGAIEAEATEVVDLDALG